MSEFPRDSWKLIHSSVDTQPDLDFAFWAMDVFVSLKRANPMEQRSHELPGDAATCKDVCKGTVWVEALSEQSFLKSLL